MPEPLDPPESDALLLRSHKAIEAYLNALPERPVRADAGVVELRALLPGELTDRGLAAADVLELLITAGQRGTVATTGPRYFGFVNGGSLPVARAAEALVVGWDQNASMAVMSPLASVVEEIAGRWLIEVLGLPTQCSYGFVTGGQAANTTCLAAARHHVLAAVGWDVETKGLLGAPPITTIVGAQAHATIGLSLRYLGLGLPTVVVPADDRGAWMQRLVWPR